MTKKSTGRHPRGLSAGQASYLLPSSPRHTEGIRTAGIHKEYGKAVPIFRIPFVNVHLLRKLTNGMTVVFMAFSFLLFLLPAPAHAACTNPAGQNGDMVYNADENVPQVCANDGWLALGILNSGAGTTGCSNPGGAEGSVVYNTDIHKPQYCNGDDWVEMIGLVSGGGGSACTAPASCPNAGDLCSDGSLFAGFMLYAGTCAPLYVTDNNQSTSSNWSSAITLCDSNTYHGKSDWYLPSANELNVLWDNHVEIDVNAAGAFTTGNYWSATEYANDTAQVWYQSFLDSNRYFDRKNRSNAVRCVRRD